MKSPIGGVVLAGLLLASVGCGTEPEPVPPVASDRLVAALVDLHLAGARSERFGDMDASWHESVLAQHGLTQADLDEALDFYAANRDAYLDLYTAVLDSLNAARDVPTPEALSEDTLTDFFDLRTEPSD
ncbi:MAG: DUF4296 domain-containing protein [Bacteroidota bacterium]